MSNVTTNNDGGMSEAIDEMVQQFRNGGPDTQQKIVIKLAKQNKSLVIKLQLAWRHVKGAANALLDDEEADQFVAELIKKAERKLKR
jgi:hypothetical protein